MRYLSLIYCITLLGFLIGAHNGYIALWIGEDPQPAKVYPYKISLLPENDRQKLEKGIRVENEQELLHLLEDYMS